MIKEAKTRGYVVGFTDLGNTDEFSTEMLEWRIAHVMSKITVFNKKRFSVELPEVDFGFQAEVINYSGDLNTPPDEASKAKKTNFVGKKVKGRGARDDESSDENDW
jgi:hypothetical protein